MPSKTRVLIVADYPAVRADLQTVLELVEGVETAGEAACGSEALRLAETIQPDIVLVDLDMIRRTTSESIEHQPPGCDLIRQLKTRSPNTSIYVLSALGSPVVERAVLSEGADAVFIKGVNTEKLFERIHNFRMQNERNVEMEKTHDLHLGSMDEPLPLAKPILISQERASTRLAYIDTLRMVLIVLVIMVHAAVTYGAIGDWTYVTPSQDELTVILLSIFLIYCQSFFMGLYFLYAGYFTPRSYDRKGPALFWKDRLLRLAIPMVAYTLVLSKLPNYISWVANDGMRLSFGEYFVRYFWQDADAGPTWFLFTLLIFSVGYTVWRLLTPISGSGARLSRLPIPGTRTLLLVGLLMAMMTFVVSQILPIGEGIRLFGAIPQLIQFFPTYILLFIGGVLAYRNDWLTRLPGKSLRFWSWLSAGLLVALPALLMFGGAPDGYMDEFLGGLNWRCATFCLWLGLACVSFSMTLSLWLRERVKPGDRLSAYVGPNNFAVYLIHPLILVPIAWVLTFSGIPGMLKFGLLSASTVLLCFLLADVLRRVPGLKQVL